MTPHSPSKLGSLPEQVRSSSVFGCFVVGIHTPLHAMIHGREVQSARIHCGAPVGAGFLVCVIYKWHYACGLGLHAMIHGREVQSARIHCGAPVGAAFLVCVICKWHYACSLGQWVG